MTYTLIAHTEVGSGGSASIVFNSIPQTFTDLLLVTSLRGNFADTYSRAIVNFNSTSTGYTTRILYGSGSGSGVSLTETNRPYISVGVGTSATASTFSNDLTHIPNYRVAANKSFSTDSVSENNATNAFQFMMAHLWASTDAITSMTITPFDGSSLAQYSSATLYGITAGSDGTTVVS
jgi:hypothetical protein